VRDLGGLSIGERKTHDLWERIADLKNLKRW
jgi:hypothetical protein